MRLAFLVLLSVFFSGCSSKVTDDNDYPGMDSLIVAARREGDSVGPRERLHFLDSALQGKSLSASDRFRVYTMRHYTYYTKLLDYQRAKLYADSMVWIVSNFNVKDPGDKQFTAYKQLAEIQYALEDYKLAYENYDIARYIADTVKAGGVKAKYMAGLGMAYFKEEEYRQAARMFVSAYKYSLHTTSKEILHFQFFRQEQLSNAGLAYSRAGMTDSAFYFFRTALSFIDSFTAAAEQQNSTLWNSARAVVYGNFASTFKDNGQLDSALVYFNRSLEISRKNKTNTQDYRYNLLKTADVFLSLRNPVAANTLIMESDTVKIPERETQRAEDTVEYALRSAQLKARYFRESGDHNEAYYWLDRHYHFIEMRNARTQKIKLNNIESGVNNIGHEKQLQTLEKDHKIHNQRIAILVLVIVISVCAIIIIYYYMRLHKLNLEKLKVEKELIITESKTQQERLQQQMDVDRANYLALLENTEDCLWSLDKQFNLLAFNRVYQDFIKVVTGKEARVGDRDELENTSPEFYRQIFSGYQAALSGKVYNSMDEGIKTGGVHFDYAMRFSPVRDHQGKITGVSCSRKDITEYFKLTDSLKKNTEQFKNIAWLQSHALRGPLTTIMGIAELLSDDDDKLDQENMRELLKGMKEKLNELDKLVNQIVKLTY